MKMGNRKGDIMGEMLRLLDSADRAISKTVRVLCTVSMMIIFIIFIANIFVRFVPIYNFTTTDEWTQLFLMWTIFFGAQELVRTRGHFVVDVITDKLRGTAVGYAFSVVTAVISLVMYFAILWFGIDLVSRSQASMQTIPYMKMAYFYACIPVSAAFMSIYALRDLIQAVMGTTPLPNPPSMDG